MTKQKPPGDKDKTESSSDDTSYDTLFSPDSTETTDFFSDKTDVSDFTSKVREVMDDDDEDLQNSDSDVLQFRPKKK